MQVLSANPGPLFRHERVARDLKSYHTYCGATAISLAIMLVGGVGIVLSRVNPASLNRSIVLGMTIFSATLTGASAIGLSISLKKLSRPTNSRPPSEGENLLSEVYKDIMSDDPSYKSQYDKASDCAEGDERAHNFYSNVKNLFRVDNNAHHNCDVNLALFKAKIRNRPTEIQVQVLFGLTIAAFKIGNKELINAIIEFQEELGINGSIHLIKKLNSEDFVDVQYEPYSNEYLKQVLNNARKYDFFPTIFPLFKRKYSDPSMAIDSFIACFKDPIILKSLLQWIEQNPQEKIEISLRNLSLFESVQDNHRAMIKVSYVNYDNSDSEATSYKEISIPESVMKNLFPNLESNTLEIKLGNKNSAKILHEFFCNGPTSELPVIADLQRLFELGVNLGHQELVTYAISHISKVNIDSKLATCLIDNVEDIPETYLRMIFQKILIGLINRYPNAESLPYKLVDKALLKSMKKLIPEFFRNLWLHDYFGMTTHYGLEIAFSVYQIMEIFSQDCVEFKVSPRKELFEAILAIIEKISPNNKKLKNMAAAALASEPGEFHPDVTITL